MEKLLNGELGKAFVPQPFPAWLARMELSAKSRYHIKFFVAFYTQSQPDEVVSYNHPPHNYYKDATWSRFYRLCTVQRASWSTQMESYNGALGKAFVPQPFSAWLARMELSAKPRYRIQVLGPLTPNLNQISRELYNHPPQSHYKDATSSRFHRLCTVKRASWCTQMESLNEALGKAFLARLAGMELISSSHLLVLATNERFLPTRGTFRAILANESHLLQPMLVFSVHWWPTPARLAGMELISSSHLLVLATNERFLPTRGTFRAILANESHLLQPMLVFSVHWWPTPAGVGKV